MKQFLAYVIVLFIACAILSVIFSPVLGIHFWTGTTLFAFVGLVVYFFATLVGMIVK